MNAEATHTTYTSNFTLYKLVQLYFLRSFSGSPVPPHLQVLLAISCMATGRHQNVVGNCYSVSQTTVSVLPEEGGKSDSITLSSVHKIS